MNLYPAIDLYEGKVVRLKRGDFLEKTVYSENPEAVARLWESQGAKWLHLVDLQGAKEGEFKNLEAVEAVCKAVQCKMQFGGGVRKKEDIQRLLDAGVHRVVIGTKALDQAFFAEVMEAFADKIAVGLDVREGVVQTQGWMQGSGLEMEAVLGQLNNFPVGTIIYTDISKDGMLQGPNFSGLEEVLEAARAKVILSGGIHSLDDITQCRQINKPNFEGIIIGRALYDKKFTFQEALERIA